MYEITLLSACVCLCILPSVARQLLGTIPLIVARQRLGKTPLNVARQRLGRNITAVTNTHAAIEELLDTFSVCPLSYQGKYGISSSQNILFYIGCSVRY
jgi:hypothetical protein